MSDAALPFSAGLGAAIGGTGGWLGGKKLLGPQPMKPNPDLMPVGPSHGFRDLLAGGAGGYGGYKGGPRVAELIAMKGQNPGVPDEIANVVERVMKGKKGWQGLGGSLDKARTIGKGAGGVAGALLSYLLSRNTT